jgi:hypothetical protein
MTFVEIKNPDKKVKYDEIKKCVLKREAGVETSEECKKVFRDAGVSD